MGSYLLRRVPSALATLVLASLGVFMLVTLLPGSPVAMVLGEAANPQAVAALEHELGLDRPLWDQYLRWVGGLVTGDLGTSYISRVPVTTLLANAVPATVELAAASLLLTALIGFALGVAGATTRRRPAQAVHRALSALFFGMPEYVVGILLILALAVTVRVLPPGGRVGLFDDPVIGLQHLLMPAVALALHSAAVVGRFLEAELSRALADDYVQTALSKGVSRRRIVWRHALPNALPPVITVLGLRIGHLLGGAVVIEAIFAWPGLGQVLANAVSSRDYIVVEDLVVMSIALFIVVQLVTDIAHAALDPRLRLERSWLS